LDPKSEVSLKVPLTVLVGGVSVNVPALLVILAKPVETPGHPPPVPLDCGVKGMIWVSAMAIWLMTPARRTAAAQMIVGILFFFIDSV